jgi:hypothetical protein
MGERDVEWSAQLLSSICQLIQHTVEVFDSRHVAVARLVGESLDPFQRQRHALQGTQPQAPSSIAADVLVRPAGARRGPEVPSAALSRHGRAELALAR